MSRVKWALVVLASLLVHTALWYGYDQYRQSQVKKITTVPLFTTSIITQRELDARIRQQRGVVESNAPEVDRPAETDDAAYLSDRNRRVKKETIARGDGNGGGAARRAVRRPLDLRPNLGPPKFKLDPETSMASGNLSYGSGPTGSDDLVKSDVVAGAETMLNSDEYKYSPFFSRIKDEIVPRWKPRVRQITRTQRKLPEGVYLTDITVSTDRDGSITMVEIARSSGFSPFDQAAVDSFWNLARFRNVPQEFLDRSERFVTSFSFSVQVTNRGVWFDSATENEEKRWAKDDPKNR